MTTEDCRPNLAAEGACSRAAAGAAEPQACRVDLECLVYALAHELGGPLRAIEGYTQFLQQKHHQGFDPESRRALGVVNGEARHLTCLISALLAFFRSEGQPLSPTRVDMTSLAQEVFHTLMDREPRRQVQLDLAPLPDAQGDPMMLRQVLMNLLSNAWKFTQSRPVGLIQITGQSLGAGHCEYCIRDNGVGFNRQDANQIFRPFARLHARADYEGNGLGLAIVQRILQRQGGRIWADSALEQGASFWFTVPAA